MSVNSCQVCGSRVIKWGKTSGFQRYRCLSCGKTSRLDYVYKSYAPVTNATIVKLVKESVGIRGISRFLSISKTTVLRRIKEIASRLKSPELVRGRSYEVDEMRTYVGRKSSEMWVVCALDRVSKRVVSLQVGRRTKTTLRQVIGTLLLSEAEQIYTDKLNIYKGLIPKDIHSIKTFGTNGIERLHLSIRTHVKRLNRRTLCYSKDVVLLRSCLRIYLWG